MQKKVVETSATTGIGFAPEKKIFKVPSGTYNGRKVCIFQASSSEIKLCYADKPYTNWSSLVVIASDAADFPFDAVMDSEGNIFVVYSEQTTNYLVSKKLILAQGNWSVGAKVYIYNGGTTYAPSLVLEKSGKLWVSWSRIASGFYDIQVKSSVDSGATWGTGTTDIGDTLKAGLNVGVSKIVITSNDLFVVYTGNGTDIFMRSQSISGGGWTPEYIIASGSDIDDHFDVTVSSDGLLSVVYDDNQLCYREYDGRNWSAVTVLDSNEASFPQLLFINNFPVVIYLTSLSAEQILINYVHRRTGSFSSPSVLDNRARQFDTVLLYDSTSSNYADLSNVAADDITADIFHPSSGVMVKNSGDILYLGMEQPFRFIKFILATAGSGGTVNYSYWDGSNWQGVTLVNGIYHLDATDKDVLLWDDFFSAPLDWQKKLINGINRFWVKIEVVSDYSIAPIGSQITAVSDIQAISVRR